MKTTKSKSKAEEVSKTKKATKRVKNKNVNFVPTEEEIRNKADELYHQRIERGESGTAEHDWREAEKLLRDSN